MNPVPEREPTPPRSALGRRFLGVPWLWAVGHSAVAFSIYYSLGLVTDHALALTPIVFAVTGLMFVVTSMTYAEGGSMYRESGGSNTLARRAFNEVVSFLAGWAILLDYVIVIALAALTIPHYLTPISGSFNDGGAEILIAAAAVLVVAAINIVGFTGRRRQGMLVGLATADLLLQFLIIVVGAAVLWNPAALTDSLAAFGTPSIEELATALVISMVALAGIEAGSDLAPDFAWRPEDLRHALRRGSVVVPFVYIAMSFVALMALPVVEGPGGPESALATMFEQAPVLGITTAMEPAWLGELFKWGVVAMAPVILLFAANATMLGLSRHVYVMATNRQIPSWLGKLGSRSTPYVAIVIAATVAIGLVFPSDIEMLAAIFAFGAIIAIAIAHVSLIRLRYLEPDRERPYRVPLSVRAGAGTIPLPAAGGLILCLVVFVSLILLRDYAFWVGGSWMAFGLVAYFLYRRVFEGIPMGEAVNVPEQALHKHRPDVDLDSVLVPVFGRGADDEIVTTACRLAVAAPLAGQSRPRVELLYVIDLPLTVPLTGPIPAGRMEEAERALARAMEVADEYPGVEKTESWVTARSVGEAIVEQAIERQVEAVVAGGEPPTRIRGGAVLGGVRAARPAEIGPITEYVLRHAPCRVLLTAPPEE